MPPRKAFTNEEYRQKIINSTVFTEAEKRTLLENFEEKLQPFGNDKRYLTDAEVERGLKMLSEGHPEVYIFPLNTLNDFIQLLSIDLEEKHNDVFSILTGAKSQNRNKPLPTKMIAAINTAQGSVKDHWVTVLFDIPKREVLLVDPLEENIHTDIFAEDACADIVNVLMPIESELKVEDASDNAVEPDRFIVSLDILGVQKDGFQCGIWVLEVAKRFILDGNTDNISKSVLGKINIKKVRQEWSDKLYPESELEPDSESESSQSNSNSNKKGAKSKNKRSRNKSSKDEKDDGESSDNNNNNNNNNHSDSDNNTKKKKSNKKSKKGSSSNNAGIMQIHNYAVQNKRAYMEDFKCIEKNIGEDSDWVSDKAAFLAIFDGHDGDTCAQWLSQEFWPELQSQLLARGSVEEAFQKTMSLLHNRWKKESAKTSDTAGSTIISCIVDPIKKKIWVCNLGDSQLVLFESNTGEIVWESTMHEITEEEEKRITQRGVGQDACFVTRYYGETRINGVLALARAFGDLHSDYSPCVGKEHDFTEIKLLEGQKYTLVLGSDGLFDELKPKTIGLEFIHKQKHDANTIGKAALEKNQAGDNITVITCQFSV
jgi:serine/threonine protein phosphatase PrpC